MEGSGLDLLNCQQPTVSVLIPAYNAGAFLRRAVRSALVQTREPLEVLIVDDASTDDTLAVANELAAEDSRVRVLTLPFNSGPAAARNVGLDAAQGDWVAVLDADDAFTLSRIEMFVSAQARKSIDIVLDNFLFFDADRGSATSAGLRIDEGIESINIYNFVEHARPYADEADWGLLQPVFRKEFLDTHGLRYPEFSRHGEDFLLMFQALHAGARCILVRTPGYLYTTRYSGMTRTTINYGMMIKHTVDLLDDPTVEADVRLCRLLRQRIVDLKRWSKRWATESRLREAKEKRNYTQIAFLALTDISVAVRAVKFLSRKIMY